MPMPTSALFPFGLQVAVVRLPDRTPLVFDQRKRRRGASAMRSSHLRPASSSAKRPGRRPHWYQAKSGSFAQRTRCGASACVIGRSVTRWPRRVGAVVGVVGHAIASPALVTESATLAACAAKSAGSVLLSRSFLNTREEGVERDAALFVARAAAAHRHGARSSFLITDDQHVVRTAELSFLYAVAQIPGLGVEMYAEAIRRGASR